jgi:hypothetical protein
MPRKRGRIEEAGDCPYCRYEEPTPSAKRTLGYLFSVSQWSMVIQMSWVLIASMFHGPDGRYGQLLIPLSSVVLFFTHPLSFVAFGRIAVALLVVSRDRSVLRGGWKTRPSALVFTALSATRLALVLIEGTERRRFSDLMGVSSK